MKFLMAGAKYVFLSIIYMALWIFGLAIGNTFFGAAVPETGGSQSGILGLMLLASALNTAVIMLMVQYSNWTGIRLVGVVALEIYAIQFFLSQIETLWFNDALGLPMNLIYAIFIGGLIVAVLFALIVVRIMDKFKSAVPPPRADFEGLSLKKILFRIGMLVILIYPLLYMTAGYFIAWQFEPLRIHYSGSAELKSFWAVLWINMENGLWLWQIARGLLWVLIAWPVQIMIRGGFPRKGIILGLLFAVLMNSQLLLPNPYMPGIIPLVHGIETASSNFLWGMAIAWLLSPLLKMNDFKSDTDNILLTE